MTGNGRQKIQSHEPEHLAGFDTARNWIAVSGILVARTRFCKRLQPESKRWTAVGRKFRSSRRKGHSHSPSSFCYGKHARVALCKKHDTGRPGWSWKKWENHILLYDYDDDNDEDFIRFPGIPPFGCHDKGWTAGPEAWVYQTQDHPEQASQTQDDPEPDDPKPDYLELDDSDISTRGLIVEGLLQPTSVGLNGIYSGIWNSATGIFEGSANPLVGLQVEGFVTQTGLRVFSEASVLSVIFPVLTRVSW
jgi:hypothetical protein